MANEESGRPLRRWRPFYGAFGAIDDAIEAAGHPRAAFRDTRARILQLLRAATDDGVAEQLCAAHDDAMVEALETLRVVPVPHSVLASTDLATAVRALKNHESPRIRSLAGDVVRGWKTAIDKELKPSDDRVPCQGISTAVKKTVMAPSEKMEAKKQKKMGIKKPIVTQSERMEAKKPITAQIEKMEAKKQPIITQSEKMETTKRKLHEGYEEAKIRKRQHLIKKIEDKVAPKMSEQSQRKMHRGPARCRTSSAVRRSLLPSLQLI